MSQTQKYLEETLQKLDKEIEEAERALIHMNKQVGGKISKLGDLKTQRNKVSLAYKEELESKHYGPNGELRDLAHLKGI